MFGNVNSYITSCFKLWSLERASSRFSYLFQTLSAHRWRTVRIHVEIVPVVSWNIQERDTVLDASAPRTPRIIYTWKLTVYCNYLFIPGERSHTRREKTCCMIVREHKKYREFCIIHGSFTVFARGVYLYSRIVYYAYDVRMNEVTIYRTSVTIPIFTFDFWVLWLRFTRR